MQRRPPTVAEVPSLLAHPQLGPWNAISCLYRFPQPDVHEQVCRFLQDLDPTDVELYLPQILNLTIFRSGTEHIESFLLKLCARSPHTCLQICWLLDAMLYHITRPLSDAARRGLVVPLHERCQDLRRRCEVACINGAVPGSLVDAILAAASIEQPDADVQAGGAAPADDTAAAGTGVASAPAPAAPPVPTRVTDERRPADHSRTAAAPAQPAQPGPAAAQPPPPAPPPPPPPHAPPPQSDPDGGGEGDAALTAAAPAPDARAASPPTTPPPPSPRVATRAEPASGPLLAAVRPLLSTQASSKQARLLFFEHEQRFVHELVSLSARLRSVPPDMRAHVLRNSLERLNAELPRGVYVPLGSAALPHLCVARIAVDECHVLSSRERVPFWVMFEVCDAAPLLHTPGGTLRASPGPPTPPAGRMPAVPDPTTDEPPLRVARDPQPVPVPVPVPRLPLSDAATGRPAAVMSVPAGAAGAEQREALRSVLPDTSPAARSLPPPPLPPACPTGAARDAVAAGAEYDARDPYGAPGGATPRSLPAAEAPSAADVPALERSVTWPVALHSEAEGGTCADRVDAGAADARPPSTQPAPLGTAAAAAGPPVSWKQQLAPVQLAAAAVRRRTPFSERAAERDLRLRAASPFGSLPHWRTVSLIVKSGEDLRQEALGQQLVAQFQRIFLLTQLPLWLRPFRVVVTGPDAGLLEVVPDAVSLHALKGATPGFTTLAHFFRSTWRTQAALDAAKRRFTESLAAYAVVTFVLQVKDRHNGNILLCADGTLVHIDFGFMLGQSPGGMNFERAPFKLTPELVEVMDGDSSPLFGYFRALFVRGMQAARDHADMLLQLVDMARAGGAGLPCFAAGASVVHEMAARLGVALCEADFISYAAQLVTQSLGSWRSRQYDRYQYWVNGIR